VELGETMEAAIRRELLEECALAIDVAGVAGTLDRIVHDAGGRIRYHYVLIDFLAYAESDAVVAGSDAAEACWARPEEMERLDVTDGLVDMVRRALALSKERNR
jgi:ADP-ribose pyrophosphatase YjhB (NUDIX family)